MATNIPAPARKSSLVKLTPAEAKKAGQNYAIFISGARAELIKNKLKESEALKLMQSAAAFGDCSSGVMCAIFT